MLDFHQKRKLRGFVHSPVTQGILLVIALLIALSAYNRYQTATEMEARRITDEQQLQVLKDRRDALDEEVQYLSGERGIEAEIRRQFDVTKEGEKVVVIVENESEASEIQPLATSTIEYQPAWYEFWR